MRGIVSHIPNLVTLLNLSAGTLAAIFAIDGDLGTAAILIFCAGVFDFFDGFLARLLKAYSDTGKELDSLADIVSFGVAPSMIMFSLMESARYGNNIAIRDTGSLMDWFWMASPLIIVAASALRLAKFNIDTRQTVNFLGLPTPANAIIWAGFGLMTTWSGNEPLMLLLFTPSNLLIYALITSGLLVSEIPMFSLKFRGFDLLSNWYRFVFLASALLLILFAGVYAPVLIILVYISLSISFYLLKVRI